MDLTYIKARDELLNDDGGTCRQFFSANGYVLETAYYDLLHKRADDAYETFLSIINTDIRAHWGAFISSLCIDRVKGYPSYLELRNFFEIDLQLFVTYGLGSYVETVCSYADWLRTINPEVYKFIGRVFLKNGYDDIGLSFLDAGKDYMYNDPELHFLFAEYYMKQKDFKNAENSVDACLSILPEYFPAARLKQIINTDCEI